MALSARLALLLSTAALAACGKGGGDVGRAASLADSGMAAVTASPAAAPEAVADSAPAPFAERVVVFMEASPEEIQAARKDMPEDEFYVMADDLNWYRSSAWEYLQKRHIPVVRVTGRQPLRFVVADTVRSYDFTDERTLDLLVVFDGRSAPHAVAPVDVEKVQEYFGSPPDSVR